MTMALARQGTAHLRRELRRVTQFDSLASSLLFR